MKNKILWLSILGLALARPPNPIDETTLNIGLQQRQRSSRSIWPFTSSETTTETPETNPPVFPNNNEWFVQGETPLPEGIDLTKYPVWKIHKYNGIDLRPVNLQPENIYAPEIHHTYEQGYSSDHPQGNYQSGYQEYLPPGGQSVQYSNSRQGTYPPSGYPQATYPAATGSYETGEFQSSSFTPGSNQFDIQSQQKHEVYAPPQPLRDFRAPIERPVVQEISQIPTSSYGSPNAYQTTNFNYQGHNQAQQNQQYGGAGEEQSQSSDGGDADISFLNDLGGLASFLPEPTGDAEENEEREVENEQQGFLENLFSRFRGTTEAPVAADVSINEEESAANPGGFLSSLFGVKPNPQSQNVPAPTLYQPEISNPVPISPTTYYLPKTRGSYIAVKVPPSAIANFAPSIEPYSDVTKIPFHEVPSVPFTEREIPRIPGPTWQSEYPYNLGYSEIRNSASAGPAITSEYQQPVVSQYHGLPPSTKNAPQFFQTNGNYQQSNLQVDNLPLNQGADLNGPRAEYFHSGNNDHSSGVPTSVNQPTSGTEYHQGQQNSQESQYPGVSQIQSTVTVPQLQDELPTSYESDQRQTGQGNSQEIQYQNFGTTNSHFQGTTNSQGPFDHNQGSVSFAQNVKGNNQEFQYQNLGTTNSNFQGTTNAQGTFDYNQGSVSFAQNGRGNEPVSAPQTSGGFLPSLGYNLPLEENNPLTFNVNNQENSQQIPIQNSHVAFDQSRSNIGAGLTQNFDVSSGVLNHDLQPPKENESTQPSGPVIQQNQISATQSNFQLPYESYRILPVKEANDFHEVYSDQNDEDNRFIQNVNALTSYGTPTSSYQLNTRVPASSNIRTVTIPAPRKDEVNDGLDNNTNKDVSRTTLPEQTPTRKTGRIIRKVTKRKTLLENNHSRRSAPERQAPSEETDAPLIVRSENDSIPELVKGSRQFHGTEVVDGYSKVQHKEHEDRQVIEDAARATVSVNPALETVQE